MQTRFLYAVISSLLFDGEKTCDQFHEAVAEDATMLFRDGVEVFWLF